MKNFQKILFTIINGLFVVKYSLKFEYNLLITITLYALIVALFFLLENKFIQLLNDKQSKYIYFLLTTIIASSILALLAFINPLHLQVDRWSAIHNFLENLFNNIYPYSAHTHLGGYGSPFPVWQIFHIPFYLLGDVGFGMFFSVMLLAVLLVWILGSYKKSLIYLILLCISPAFWYEVAVRSDLFYNFLLCFLAIAIIYKKKFSIQNQSIGLGILCGLFLSTRFSAAIPFAMILSSGFLAADFRRKSLFIASILLVFTISFLPFAYWDFNTLFFFKSNPFILQTSQGSILEIIVLAILILFYSLKKNSNLTTYCSQISVTIVIFVATTFIHRMISNHFVNSLFSSSYDITYFNMALPFILFALIKNNTEELE
jgi:hypothetical protein